MCSISHGPDTLPEKKPINAAETARSAKYSVRLPAFSGLHKYAVFGSPGCTMCGGLSFAAQNCSSKDLTILITISSAARFCFQPTELLRRTTRPPTANR